MYKIQLFVKAPSVAARKLNDVENSNTDIIMKTRKDKKLAKKSKVYQKAKKKLRKRQKRKLKKQKKKNVKNQNKLKVRRKKIQLSLPDKPKQNVLQMILVCSIVNFQQQNQKF